MLSEGFPSNRHGPAESIFEYFLPQHSLIYSYRRLPTWGVLWPVCGCYRDDIGCFLYRDEHAVLSLLRYGFPTPRLALGVIFS